MRTERWSTRSFFAGPLRARREIIEFQVRQTEQGANIDIRVAARLDLGSLQGEITERLRRAGLNAPSVDIRTVAAIDRLALGKLKRYVALAPVRNA